MAVSRLGIPVAMVGRVKSDLFGHQMLSTLTEEGVNIGGVVVDSNASSKSTGVAMIIVAADKTGKNTIACRGSNDDCGLDEAMIADNLMRKRREIGIVLMQNEVAHEAIVRVAELGHLAEKLVIFKASPIRNATDISDMLYGWIDVLVVNEWEERGRGSARARQEQEATHVRTRTSHSEIYGGEGDRERERAGVTLHTWQRVHSLYALLPPPSYAQAVGFKYLGPGVVI